MTKAACGVGGKGRSFVPIKTSPLICRDLFGVPHLPKDVGESEAEGAADGASHGVHDDSLPLVALAERCGAPLCVGHCGGDLRGEHVVAERALAERTWKGERRE